MQEYRWNPELRQWLDQAARAAGFGVVGIAEVHGPEHRVAVQDAARYSAWIDAGHAGEMEYLKRRDQSGSLLRSNPRVAMPWARSVIVCAMNYSFAASPMRIEDCSPSTVLPLSIDPAPPGAGWIARYAWTGYRDDDGPYAPTDYHDELLSRLRLIESELLLHTNSTTRCYVDTGPLVERSLAAEAGIGWIGKNTCLINQKLGSWLLLGVIVTSLSVEKASEDFAENPSNLTATKSQPNHSESLLSTDKETIASDRIANILAFDRCGSCTRCIDACPTGALLGSKSADAPRTMDASRCIAYLTIEKKGAIDPDLRVAMGRHVFGCDICQDVCPWNGKASLAENKVPTVPSALKPSTSSMTRSMRNGWESKRQSLQPRLELINPALDWLAALNAGDFKRVFKSSPLERTGRKRLLRNVAIAMGNSEEARFIARLEAWTAGDDPVLAEAAQWALVRLLAL